MASKEYKKSKKSKERVTSDMPKHRQLIKMLSFRIVPAYYKEIEKVANHKSMTVSKLIRSYIKEGMKRDQELTKSEEENFRVD
jgi:predicted DNA-binding ribbon-helix-helix protein